MAEAPAPAPPREGEIIAEAESILADGKPKTLTFGVADDTAWQVGLPCGGEIKVFIERLEAGNGLQLVERAIDARSNRRGILVKTRLGDGSREFFERGDAKADDVVRQHLEAGESDLIETLKRVAEIARRHRDGETGGQPIDVLNLSLGYYHETAEDGDFDSTMYDVLELLGRCGVAVICSAGNDATARPMFPAAFWPWKDKKGPVKNKRGLVPVTSVGALNPNLLDDALFSNAGTWVSTYAEGALLMSTIPPFEGGLQPLARTKAFQRNRASVDPDDYRGRFALWSGTSLLSLKSGSLPPSRCGPLSEEKSTSVFSSMFNLFKRSSKRPTSASSREIIAARASCCGGQSVLAYSPRSGTSMPSLRPSLLACGIVGA